MLYDYARRLSNHRKGRRAVHLFLSRLSRASQHPQDINIAASHFNPLVRKYDGQLFRLGNHDIVFVAKGVTLRELDDVVLKLRYMFRDDARLRDLERSQDEDPFCTHYNMERDYEAFLANAKDLATHGASRNDAPDSSVIAFETAARPEPEQQAPEVPLLARYVSADPVYAWSRNTAPAAILSEFYFRVEALKQWYGSKRGGVHDLWLLRTLTSDLDEKTVGHLFAGNGTVPLALTIPVSPETVLDPDFEKFNAHYRSVARTPILFEFAWTTVMRNAHMFLGARDKVLQAGHKICIDGWDPYAFAFFNPARLDTHFFKVAWRETLAFEFRSEWSAPLAETVRAAGTTKIILTDCTSKAAVEFGQQHNFLLFQGSYPAKKAQ
ncbi:MAG: hypothetical protein D6763_06060 [Alphaproteobacteria bacterium]|nr:MAG: hypothetical protein D6763_06060 [Alphaproteobacteria bacterium]